MKIAIPIADGNLCLHFGHCEHFTMFEVDDDNNVVNQTELRPPAHAPGVLPQWLSQQGANVVIAGGMGQRAQQMLMDNSIQVIVGAPADDPEKLVASYLAGSLATGDNVCDH